MNFVHVAGTDELQPGQIRQVEANGVKLLLANVDGNYHAAAKKCPHMGANLCKGKLEDGAVICPLHKAKFDLTTGKVMRDPKLLFIKMKAKRDLTIYPVKVEGGDIFVGI
jgi:nitrite reductase/ring-hydroxylating ferredoxin subunit